MDYKIFGPIGTDPASVKEQERARSYVECTLALDNFMLATNLATCTADLALRLVVDALQPDATAETRARAQTEIFNLHAVVHATHKRRIDLNDIVRTAADLGRDVDNRA